MGKTLRWLLLLALTGCAALPPPPPRQPSPCDAGEATPDCQIQRYRDVAA